MFGDSHDLQTNPLRIASVKSNIGHAEIAAGMFSLIKTIQMLQHKVFLPTAGVTTPLTAYDWAGHNLRVQQEVEPFPENGEPVVVGINSFGIGGSYGHAIIEEYRGPAMAAAPSLSSSFPRLLSGLSRSGSSSLASGGGSGSSGSGSGLWDEPADETHMLALSAASLPHLQRYAERLAAYLRAQAENHQQQEQEQEEPSPLLRDLCATLWCHRSRFAFRRAFHAVGPLELAAQLEAFAQGGGDGVKPAGEGRKMQACFVFTGQGAQYPGVGQALMRFPVYRKAVQAVDKQFRALAGWSILEKLGTLPAAELKETMYAQPASFLVQVCCWHVSSVCFALSSTPPNSPPDPIHPHPPTPPGRPLRAAQGLRRLPRRGPGPLRRGGARGLRGGPPDAGGGRAGRLPPLDGAAEDGRLRSPARRGHARGQGQGAARQARR